MVPASAMPPGEFIRSAVHHGVSVKCVINTITLETCVTATEVMARIEAAFGYNVELHSQKF